MAPIQKQLFLSSRVVTETEVFHGGVLVNESGTIEKLLRRDEVDKVLAVNGDKIKVVDGGSLALLAGVVDSHVHVNEPGRTAWEGFRTATAAAAQGGITTIVDMPLNSIPPTTTIPNLKTKASSAKGNVYIDVGFWGGVIPGNQESLRDLVAAGVVGFKCFLCPSGVDEFPNVQAEHLQIAFKTLEGSGTVLAFHAEIDQDNVDGDKIDTKNGQGAIKDPEEYETYLESRPPQMELNAISLVTSFLDKTDVRVHIVHVSSSAVVPLLQEARNRRAKLGHKGWMAGVTSETCHHYLSLSAEDVPRGHSEFKCAPPIRDLNNKETLWRYIKNHSIDLIVSDHSPCTPDLKCANNLEAWGGISSVQFGLPLFWTEASTRGFALFHISRFLSSGPANLCGLRGRKGALEANLDADLVFFDSEATFVVTTEMIRHKNKLTPYLGKKLKGVVKQTYLRGQLIYSDGELVGEPKGLLLLNEVA